jgi:hypothetical protein
LTLGPDQVNKGGKVEDVRVELKGDWPDPVWPQRGELQDTRTYPAVTVLLFWCSG